MSDVEHYDEKLFHRCFTLPGSSDGCTPSLGAQSRTFLALGPRESLRTALTGTKSNIKQIFKQLFLCVPCPGFTQIPNSWEWTNMRMYRRNMFRVFIIDRDLIDSVHFFFLHQSTHKLRRCVVLFFFLNDDLFPKIVSSISFLQSLE